MHAALAKRATRFVLIYDRIIEKQLQPLKHALNPLCLALESGEGCKTRAVKEYIEDALIQVGMGSDTTIIACGGGTVLDVAGFVAATYCRGVPLILFPSTLLAMVDAAIGGKNGINVGKNKNCLGTIYHPQDIYIDTAFLDFLPAVELQNGLAEMLKISLITGRPKIVGVQHISEAIQMKQEIVQMSQTCPKVRDVLNFGHTFAHAYEALTDFRIAHGQAVLLGMAAEAFVSYRMGHMSKEVFEDVLSEIVQINRPVMKERFSLDAWFTMLQKDKKNAHGDIHIVLLKERAQLVEMRSSKVSKEYILQAIDWLQNECANAVCIDKTGK